MEIIRRVFTIMQKVLIKLLLSLVYIIGFGFTYIFAAIFKRRLLWGEKKNEPSFWKKAQGYSPDMKDSLEQS